MSLSAQCRGGAAAHHGALNFNRPQLNSKRNPAFKPPALLPFRSSSLTMNECNNAGRALFAPSPFGGPPRSLARVSRQPSAKGPRQADGVPGAARAVADGYQVLPSDIVKYHLGLLRRSSSLLKSCTLRRVLRLLQTFLDSHSHFDAQRVISRVVYNAEERACACSEAAVKVVRRWVFCGYLARPLCPDSALTRAAVRFARSLARSLARQVHRHALGRDGRAHHVGWRGVRREGAEQPEAAALPRPSSRGARAQRGCSTRVYPGSLRLCRREAPPLALSAGRPVLHLPAVGTDLGRRASHALALPLTRATRFARSLARSFAAGI